MPYSAQISRTNPACILFVIDQSKSMEEPLAGSSQSKSMAVADSVNKLLQNLVLRSAKADGVRDYFHVGVVGYGKTIKTGFGDGSTQPNVILPISRVADSPLRLESRAKLISDGAGGVIEQKVKFPVWFNAEASGQTPMCEAFVVAATAIKKFIDSFPNAFPPMILNLTDGVPSDGNPQENARNLRALATTDGSTLLFNLLLSTKPVPADYFPANEDKMSDNLCKLLFRMSSELPPAMWEAAKAEGHDIQPKARGVVINADPTALVRFLDIGTRVTPTGR